MSKHDIESGARWSIELSSQLEESDFGILCLTPDNLSSPWLLFEAGALTKMMGGRACGILFNELTPADVTGPIAQFQHRKFELEEMKALMTDLNSRLKKPLEESQLGIIFGKFWADLDNQCTAAISRAEKTTPTIHRRDQYDILSEVLGTVRDIERKIQGISQTNLPDSLRDTITGVLLSLSKEDFRPLTFLVGMGGNRVAQSFDEFKEDHSLESINRLAALGLITIQEREGKRIIEIVHEAVARAVLALWPGKCIA